MTLTNKHREIFQTLSLFCTSTLLKITMNKVFTRNLHVTIKVELMCLF